MKSTKAVKKVTKPLEGILLAIDPSSNHFAFTVASNKKNKVTIKAFGKIQFGNKSTVTDRCKVIAATLPDLLKKYKVDTVLIEKSIMIQNPNTTITLAYVNGYIYGKAVESGVKVFDVIPLVWKSWLGYKNVTKKEIAVWEQEIGKTEANKKAAFERKNRTKVIVLQKIPNLEIEDSDIIDSMAISLWGVNNLG